MKIKGTNISISYHETPKEHKRLAKKYAHLNHKIKATPKDTRSSQTVLQSVEGFLDWTEESILERRYCNTNIIGYGDFTNSILYIYT